MSIFEKSHRKQKEILWDWKNDWKVYYIKYTGNWNDDGDDWWRKLIYYIFKSFFFLQRELEMFKRQFPMIKKRSREEAKYGGGKLV